MTVQEAYRVLDLAPPVTAEEVKKAYRRKALESHPDRFSDERDQAYHQKRFLEVRDAYARLRAEGFPELPEEAVAAIDPSPKIAGRSFAPREAEPMGEAEKLGLGFSWKPETMLIWGIGLPAAAIVLAYFVRLLANSFREGTP